MFAMKEVQQEKKYKKNRDLDHDSWIKIEGHP
jgi:hypothetical protein